VIRALRLVALCGVLIAVRPPGAYAEWHLTPFIASSFGGDTNFNLTQVRRHWSFGGTVRLVGAGPLGLESIFVYVPGPFESIGPENSITKSHTFALMGNVVLTTPRSWSEYGLRPFVSGGLGWLRATHNDIEFPVRANLAGYNVGGGAVGFLTDKVGVRFDLRFYRTVPPGEKPGEQTLTGDGGRVRLHYWTGSVGVVFKY